MIATYPSPENFCNGEDAMMKDERMFFTFARKEALEIRRYEKNYGEARVEKTIAGIKILKIKNLKKMN